MCVFSRSNQCMCVCVCVCESGWREGRRDGEGASEKSGEGPALCDLRRQTVVEVEKQTHSQSMGMCAHSMSEETL